MHPSPWLFAQHTDQTGTAPYGRQAPIHREGQISAALANQAANADVQRALAYGAAPGEAPAGPRWAEKIENLAAMKREGQDRDKQEENELVRYFDMLRDKIFSRCAAAARAIVAIAPMPRD